MLQESGSTLPQPGHIRQREPARQVQFLNSGALLMLPQQRTIGLGATGGRQSRAAPTPHPDPGWHRSRAPPAQSRGSSWTRTDRAPWETAEVAGRPWPTRTHPRPPHSRSRSNCPDLQGETGHLRESCPNGRACHTTRTVATRRNSPEGLDAGLDWIGATGRRASRPVRLLCRSGIRLAGC